MEPYFVKGYGPESFGIGFNGWPLTSWLEGANQFVDLGEEEVQGIPCSKILILRSAGMDAPKGAPIRHPLGVLWVDEKGSLLVLQARTYVPAEAAAFVHDESETLRFDGREFVPMATWKVLKWKSIGRAILPTKGWYQLNVQSPLRTYEVELEPRLGPANGWPTGTFELPYYKGAIIRDVHTGESRSHDTHGVIGVQLEYIEQQLRIVRDQRALAPFHTEDDVEATWLDASCGTVAVYMYLRVHDEPADAASIARALGDAPEADLDMSSLKDQITSHGLPIHAYELEVQSIRDLVDETIPMVMRLALPGKEVGHYVLAFAGAAGIHVYDPTTTVREITYESLAESVGGKVQILVGQPLSDGSATWSWPPLVMAGVSLVLLCVVLTVRRLSKPNASLLAVGLMGVLLVACSEVEGTSASPGFVQVQDSPLAAEGGPIVDLGDREYGSQVEGRIRVRNVCDEPVRIDSVVTTCGCTTASFAPEVLLAGEEGVLTYTFDMDVKFRREVRIYLISRSLENPWLATFDITADLRGRTS